MTTIPPLNGEEGVPDRHRSTPDRGKSINF